MAVTYRAWLYPAARGTVAVVPALIITFTSAHPFAYLAVAFGTWALVDALLVQGLVGLLLAKVSRFNRQRALLAAIGTVAGVVAIVVVGGGSYIRFVLAGWAIVAGLMQLLVPRVWDRVPAAGNSQSESVALALATCAVGVALLVAGDPVSAVGFFGAYLIVVAGLCAVATVAELVTPRRAAVSDQRESAREA